MIATQNIPWWPGYDPLNPLLRGCVAAYPMWEGSGSKIHNVLDPSFRTDGVLTNMDPATAWVVSEGGYALDFDGSNDYVNLGIDDPVDGLKSVMFSCWVKTDQLTSDAMIMTKGKFSGAEGFVPVFMIYRDESGFVSGRPNMFAVRMADGDLDTTLFIDGAANSSSTTNWQHVAGVFDGHAKELRLYVDGVEDANSPVSATASVLQSNNKSVLLGDDDVSTSRVWSGLLGDALIYNRAPSASEIHQIYQLGRGGLFKRRPRREMFVPPAVIAGATPYIIGGGVGGSPFIIGG